jgi:Ca2+-binding RTX toxin-like protein
MIIHGTGWNDLLTGTAFNDSLIGYEGDDLLFGYGGDDRLDAFGFNAYNMEYDYLAGGRGNDVFVLGDHFTGIYYQGWGLATIADFEWYADYIELPWYAADGLSFGYGEWTGDWFAMDTLIMHYGEPIGLIQDTTNVDIWRDFLFV